MEEVKKKLQDFFAPDEIEFRVGATNKEKNKGLALPYVTNRAIQNRLDDVFGPLGWKNEFKEWRDKAQICGISVWDEEKREWVTKWDGADNSDFEATKGGLSDAMKRAAYHWGIGRYLYKFPVQWVKIKPQGKSFAMSETPKIPDEFLPEAYRNGKGPDPVIPMGEPEGGDEDKKQFLGTIEEIARKVGFTKAELDEISKNKYEVERKKLGIPELSKLMDFVTLLHDAREKLKSVPNPEAYLTEVGKQKVKEFSADEARKIIEQIKKESA